jgi:hypothetical protein
MIDKLLMMNKSQFSLDKEACLKQTAKDIIKINYGSDHSFVFDNDHRGYDASFDLEFICSKCKYLIEIIFCGENDWNGDEDKIEKFLPDNYRKFARLYYFGESRILNNDKIEIITCNEYIIKKLLE